jgi:hypothetical protein
MKKSNICEAGKTELEFKKRGLMNVVGWVGVGRKLNRTIPIVLVVFKLRGGRERVRKEKKNRKGETHHSKWYLPYRCSEQQPHCATHFVEPPY